LEEEDINEAYAAHLLLDAALSMRMTAYGIGVENPSAGGLKLDLDRLTRELDKLVRDCKRALVLFLDRGAHLLGLLDEFRRRLNFGGSAAGSAGSRRLPSGPARARNGTRGRGETVDARDLKSLFKSYYQIISTT
jgi:hypothetical protein